MGHIKETVSSNRWYLDNLQIPSWVVNQIQSGNLIRNRHLEIWVADFVKNYAREKIINQRHEQWFIFVH